MKNVTKQELEKWYLEEKLSTRAIAEKLETSQPTARKFMKGLGIAMRTYKDNKTPVAKGSQLPEEHRQKIGKALEGNTNWLDKETGKHFNFQQEEVDCTGCGVKVFKKQCHLEKHKPFCTTECHDEWRSINTLGSNNPKYTSITVECSWCGTELIRKPSQIERAEIYFCDVKCNGQWKSHNLTGDKIYNWTGGYKGYYGENWYRQRRLALERDNYTCQNCDKTKYDLKKNPDVHHIVKFRQFGLERYEEANHLDNLICYCNKCHTELENK